MTASTHPTLLKLIDNKGMTLVLTILYQEHSKHDIPKQLMHIASQLRAVTVAPESIWRVVTREFNINDSLATLNDADNNAQLPARRGRCSDRVYRGKRCVVTLEPDVVQWAHMLDAALSSSTPQVFPPPSLHYALS